MDVRPRSLTVDRDGSKFKHLFESERCAIRTHHVNVLIQGSNSFVADVLGAIRRDLNQPEFVWPDVPADGDMRSATVLVPEVGALPVPALDPLADLIACSHTQVQLVVTSSVILYELVTEKQFPAELYYRLNIVMLTDEGLGLTDEATAS